MLLVPPCPRCGVNHTDAINCAQALALRDAIRGFQKDARELRLPCCEKAEQRNYIKEYDDALLKAMLIAPVEWKNGRIVV